MIRVTYCQSRYVDLEMNKVDIERVRQLLDNLHGPESCFVLSAMRIEDDRNDSSEDSGDAT